MSSQSKRKAESEEVPCIKKLRKGDNDDFNDLEDEDIGSEFDDEDELEQGTHLIRNPIPIDSRLIIPFESWTRGKLGHNGEAAKTPSQVEVNGPESDMAGKGKEKDTTDKYHPRSAQGKQFFEEEGGESEEDDHDEDVTSGDEDDSEEEEEVDEE